jgi:hypothetical protein
VWLATAETQGAADHSGEYMALITLTEEGYEFHPKEPLGIIQVLWELIVQVGLEIKP